MVGNLGYESHCNDDLVLAYPCRRRGRRREEVSEIDEGDDREVVEDEAMITRFGFLESQQKHLLKMNSLRC